MTQNRDFIFEFQIEKLFKDWEINKWVYAFYLTPSTPARLDRLRLVWENLAELSKEAKGFGSRITYLFFSISRILESFLSATGRRKKKVHFYSHCFLLVWIILCCRIGVTLYGSKFQSFSLFRDPTWYAFRDSVFSFFFLSFCLTLFHQS